jgi:prephenate dehydrogenase
MPLRSVSYELDAAIMSRILSLNPRIYEDIQFENPHVPAVLDGLLEQLATLRRLVGNNDAAARQEFREHFLASNRDTFGDAMLADGNYTFECVGYLLADMVERRSVSVHLPEDRSGSLRALLQVFEAHGISIDSIHSSRTPAGEVHFRLGFSATVADDTLAQAVRQIEASAIGRVLSLRIGASAASVSA